MLLNLLNILQKPPGGALCLYVIMRSKFLIFTQPSSHLGSLLALQYQCTQQTTQYNNYHITEHTHIPRRTWDNVSPCGSGPRRTRPTISINPKERATIAKAIAIFPRRKRNLKVEQVKWKVALWTATHMFFLEFPTQPRAAVDPWKMRCILRLTQLQCIAIRKIWPHHFNC